MKAARCLCEICTCGRHRCPHKPTRIYDNGQQPCLTTEYVEKYPKYSNISPPQSLKPKQEYQVHRGRMEGITTFKSDYLPYDIVKRPFRVQEEYKPKTGEIELGTTYQKDYNAHKIQPVTLVRPLERKHTTGGKLDTIPTYQGMANSFKQRKALVLRTLVGFPAKSLEKRLVELECSVQLTKCKALQLNYISSSSSCEKAAKNTTPTFLMKRLSQ